MNENYKFKIILPLEKAKTHMGYASGQYDKAADMILVYPAVIWGATKFGLSEFITLFSNTITHEIIHREIEKEEVEIPKENKLPITTTEMIVNSVVGVQKNEQLLIPYVFTDALVAQAGKAQKIMNKYIRDLIILKRFFLILMVIYTFLIIMQLIRG